MKYKHKNVNLQKFDHELHDLLKKCNLHKNKHDSPQKRQIDSGTCLCRLCLKLKGKQGSGPEGVNDLCFHTYGQFSPSSPSPPPSLPLKSQSQGLNSSLEAQT